MNESETVILPRSALLEFFGEMALPPWRDEHGREIGGRIDCAPIAQKISEWVDTHDLTGAVANGTRDVHDPEPLREHQFDHVVESLLGFRGVCRCGWRSELESSNLRAQNAVDDHARVGTPTPEEPHNGDS